MRLPTGSIIGQFGKGIDGSISVNFGVSGGLNCDDRCVHKGSTCYAERIEIRPDRVQLRDKLKRHQRKRASQVCGQAIIEIQRLLNRGRSIPWVRFSTSGSLPQPSKVRQDKLFRTQFRTLVRVCVDNGIPVHIPVETHAKARFYRSLVGDLVTIRESAQTARRFIWALDGALSFVVGSIGQPLLDRIREAREMAAKRTHLSGRKTIVCPAVTCGFRAKLGIRTPNPLAKCGSCTACADPEVDVVYPLH